MRVAAIAFFLLLPITAMAQSVPPVATSSPLWDALSPMITPVLSALGMLLAAYVVLLVKTVVAKFGIKVDSDRATKLLMNAASAVIMDVGPALAAKIEISNPALAAAATEALKRGAPILASVGVTPENIVQHVLEKIPQVLPVETPASVIVAPVTGLPAS